MRKAEIKILCKANQWKNILRDRKYVSGVTVIEMVLILVILIALLVIFKEQLTELINTIFEKVTTESAGI